MVKKLGIRICGSGYGIEVKNFKLQNKSIPLAYKILLM